MVNLIESGTSNVILHTFTIPGCIFILENINIMVMVYFPALESSNRKKTNLKLVVVTAFVTE